MVSAIEAQDLRAWDAFFEDPEVDLDFNFDGPITCVSKRFFPQSNLKFSSSLGDTAFSSVSSSVKKDTALFGLKHSTNYKPQSLSSILAQTGLPQNTVSTNQNTEPTDAFSAITSAFLHESIAFVLAENAVSGPGNPAPQQPNTPSNNALEVDPRMRNAIWINSSPSLQINTVLVFTPEAGLGSLKDLLWQTLKIKLDDFEIDFVRLIVQRTSIGTQASAATDSGAVSPTVSWSISSTHRITWQISIGVFVIHVTFRPTGVEVNINTLDEGEHSDNGHFWAQITKLIPGLAGQSLGLDESGFFGEKVHLLKVNINWGSNHQVIWQVIIAADVSGGGPSIYLMYDSSTVTFVGGLILSGFYASDAVKLTPGYEQGRDIDLPKRLKGQNPGFPDNWDMASLFSGIPKNLPTHVFEAFVAFRKGSDDQGSILRIEGHAIRLVSPGTTPPQSSFPSPFAFDKVDFSFTKQGNDVQCSISTDFKFESPSPSISSAEMSLTFVYDKAGWDLRGHAENLSFGLLGSFFEEGIKDAVMDMFRKLHLKELDLFWTHDKDGEAVRFLFSAILAFGDLELRLFYQYAKGHSDLQTAILAQDKTQKEINARPFNDGSPSPPAISPPPGKTAWILECYVQATTDNATIGSIANSIADEVSSNLPSFVTNISIPRSGSSSGRPPISLKAQQIPISRVANQSPDQGSSAANDPGSKIVFVFQFAIASFALTFVQVGDVPAKPPMTKRLIRFAIDKIPLLDKVPLLDKLPQPFDQLEYVWVGDSGGGFGKDDIDFINASRLLDKQDWLIYKDPGKSVALQDLPLIQATGSQRPLAPTNPSVLVSGHHFIVVQGGQVALDHVFKATAAQTVPQRTSGRAGGSLHVSRSVSGRAQILTATPAAGTSSKTPETNSPTKGIIGFKLGPLTIDAVTLQYKEQSGTKAIVITMDATFVLGPITFILLGFGLSLALSDQVKLNDLSHALDHISVVLSGLALSFNQPPILVSGGFEHIKERGIEAYQGGVGIGFPPYTFVGLGQYAIIQKDNEDFKSVFLYAKLDGPLVTLAFATISGVRLGLGFNSSVSSPSIDELTIFPFINDKSINGVGNDPMAILKRMIAPDPRAGGKIWVQPKLKSYWLAAGLTLTAFDILHVTAVAVFAMSSAGVVISIFADAIATMPPHTTHGTAIVYAEIGMIAEMNFIDGYFRVEAALAPTSYLLVVDCHLYGGFALVYWFDPSDHAGDWVFSIGGYHRSYTPPPWYPVPRRLGISFSIDIISIVGEAYFAITPKCVMGGAMIHASLAFGPLQAWLDFTFDALINFHPLHYDVSFSVSVGVKCKIDLLFVHTTIKVCIGASLRIQGPKFGGVAHVDFWVLAFDVNFGDQPQLPPPLNIHQFFLMLHKPGPESNKDDSQSHESPLLTYIKVESLAEDQNLSTIGNALVHDPKLLIDTIGGAALKFVLEEGNFPMPTKRSDSTDTGDATSTGAGAKWFVKGGSFKFQVNSDYAVRDAIIARADPNQPRYPDPKIPKPDPDPDDAKLVIASKPMQITHEMAKSTTSTLTLTIHRIVKLNPLEIETVSNWRNFTRTSKALPSAIWSAYDAPQDPARNQRPATLLDGTSNTTVSQWMGVAISAPEPFLCPRPTWPGFIPKFNASEMMKFRVQNFEGPAAAKGNWLKPDSEPLQTRYLPRPLTDEQKKKSRRDQWDETAQSWTGLLVKAEMVNDKTEGLLALFGTACGWKDQRPQMTLAEERWEQERESATGLKAWELSGKVPMKLVKNLKGVYLDLPRLGVV